MAESHEPSYYEIALTNRQVMVAFVILLVCLLSAFFSGVWIGRESTAPSQQLAANSQPAAAPVSDEGSALQELEFFSDSGDDTTGPEQDPTEAPAPPQPADTTLLEDFAGEEPEIETEPAPEETEEEPVVEAPPVRPEPVPAKAPEETREERRKRREREREEKRAAAEETKAATPAARPARTTEPAVPRGSAVIQVFSSADQEQADRIRDRLVKGGYKAYLSPVETGGRTMYRVRIGPYGSRSDADTAAANVRKGYKLDTWVTE